MTRPGLPLVATVAVLMGAAGCDAGTAAADPVVQSATVEWVSDGDTFTAAADGERIRVRLLGVDAPELGHDGGVDECGARAAKAALARVLAPGRQVRLVGDPVSDRVDRYGRRLAYVAVEGVDDVALAQLEAGMVEAWYPVGSAAPARFGRYVAAQATAIDNRSGSWPRCGRLGR